MDQVRLFDLYFLITLLIKHGNKQYVNAMNLVRDFPLTKSLNLSSNCLLVPVFDCRGSFKLSSYHAKPPIKVDPEDGSIVLVIFKIRRYKEISYSVASYNVQVVLHLADPPTDSDGEKPSTPLPTYLHDLKPIGVIGSDDGEDLFAVNENTEDDPAENVY